MAFDPSCGPWTDCRHGKTPAEGRGLEVNLGALGNPELAGYWQPAANRWRKQVKSATFSVGIAVELSQFA